MTEEAFAIMKQRAIVRTRSALVRKRTGSGIFGMAGSAERVLPSDLEKIETTAEEIRNTSDVFVVIGIGGSYLGSYAAIFFLRHRFYK